MAIALVACRAIGRLERLCKHRVADDIVAFDTLCEHRAVRVLDLAAVGLNRHRFRTILLGGHGKSLVIDQLQNRQLADASRGQHGECRQNQQAARTELSKRIEETPDSSHVICSRR